MNIMKQSIFSFVLSDVSFFCVKKAKTWSPNQFLLYCWTSIPPGASLLLSEKETVLHFVILRKYHYKMLLCPGFTGLLSVLGKRESSFPKELI